MYSSPKHPNAMDRQIPPRNQPISADRFFRSPQHGEFLCDEQILGFLPRISLRRFLLWTGGATLYIFMLAIGSIRCDFCFDCRRRLPVFTMPDLMSWMNYSDSRSANEKINYQSLEYSAEDEFSSLPQVLVATILSYAFCKDEMEGLTMNLDPTDPLRVIHHDDNFGGMFRKKQPGVLIRSFVLVKGANSPNKDANGWYTRREASEWPSRQPTEDRRRFGPFCRGFHDDNTWKWISCRIVPKKNCPRCNGTGVAEAERQWYQKSSDPRYYMFSENSGGMQWFVYGPNGLLYSAQEHACSPSNSRFPKMKWIKGKHNPNRVPTLKERIFGDPLLSSLRVQGDATYGQDS